MIPNRIVGIVLVIIGVSLLVVGLNASHSMVDQVSNTIRGRFTEATVWYIIGGVAAGILGLLMLLFGRRDKNA